MSQALLASLQKSRDILRSWSPCLSRMLGSVKKSRGMSHHSFRLRGETPGSVNVPPHRMRRLLRRCRRGARPRSKMTFAEAVSRSSSHPHAQECQRSSKIFLRIVPQLGAVGNYDDYLVQELVP